MKSKLAVFLLILSLFGCKEKDSINIEPFNVTYFYNQTCLHCKRLKEELISKINDKYKDSVTITAYDIDEEGSVELYDQLIGLYDEDTQSWVLEGLLDGVSEEVACYERLVPLVVVDEYYAFLGYSSDLLDAYMQDINLALHNRQLSTGDVSNDRWVFKKDD